MSKSKIKLEKNPKNLGKQLVKIIIEASIHENGLGLAIGPSTMPTELAENLGSAVTRVLMDWNDRVSEDTEKVN